MSMTPEPTTLDPMTGRRADYAFTATDNRGLPGEFAYYRADDHIFLANIPDDLDRHYEGGYQDIPQNEEELAALAKGDAYRLDLLRDLVPEGRYLEIGPWIGLVAYTAYRRGYEVSVLERDPRCCELLSRVSKGKINANQTRDPASTLDAMGDTYDVIGLWHSIEHLPRPWEVVEAAARALRPGGVLLIAAPNPESAQLKVLGKHWLHLDAPRHIHLVPLRAYEEIGQRNGLHTILRTTDDELGRIIDDDGWKYEINRWLNPLPVLRKLRRFPLHRLAAGLLRRRSRLDGAAFTLIMQRPASPR